MPPADYVFSPIMVANFFSKLRAVVFLALMVPSSITALGDTHNNETAPAPVAALDVDQGRGQHFGDEEYWKNRKVHLDHPKCRGHFANADIAKTRHHVRQCGFPADVSCPCDHPPYRQFSGACNNPRDAGLGTATSLYNRVLWDRYADGEVSRRNIPKARVVSSTIFKDKNRKDPVYSLLLMQWGQLVTHDVGMRKDIADESGRRINCCADKDERSGRSGESGRAHSSGGDGGGKGERENPACSPVMIPRDDPFYSLFPAKCINFVRSQFNVCPTKDEETSKVKGQLSKGSSEDVVGSKKDKKVKGRHPPNFKSRSQLNMVSSFLDLSIVYGNSQEANQKLRLGEGGLLRSRELKSKHQRQSSVKDDSGEFLPLSTVPVNGCNPERNICYMVGDDRVNQHPWLASMQTLLLREHNRLARRLRGLHPKWDDEKLFQEARRILIAIWQLITYRDYLPKIVGEKILKRMDMVVNSDRRSKYSSRVNPSTLNEFSQGAFRFFHSQIDGTIELMGCARCPLKKLNLSEQFNNPGVLESGHNFEAIVRGMRYQAAQQADRFVTQQMTTGFGDLVSDDIQRGRDHGLPSYNAMRHVCGLPKAIKFDDFRDVMKDKSVNMLKSLYRSVNDVDLYVGGTLEEHCVDGDHSALTGPTFGCIIAEQFFRWRRGDRYFFDHAKGPGAFTKEQYVALNEVTLASILCENLGEEKYMQLDPFMRVSRKNKLKECKYIPKLNMKPWKNYNPPDGCHRITNV